MITLITIVTFLALPSVSSIFSISINSATRELASTVREAYNSAMMRGLVYRVAFDLKDNTFWVEKGPATLMLDTRESTERDARKARYGTEMKPVGADFSPDTSISRSKRSLPRGVRFERVLTERSPDPVSEGTAYTHIFPHGLTEQTVIHLRDSSDHQITLALEPLTGRTRLLQGHVRPEEAFGGK